MSDPSLLTLVLTHTDASRRRLSRNVVIAAARQKYRPVEVLVLNATDKPLVSEVDAIPIGVKELRCDAGLTPAAIRNIALDHIRSGWISFVDYDEFFHPDRFLLQIADLARCDPHTISVLPERVLIDVSPAFAAGQNPSSAIEVIPKKKIDSVRGISSTAVIPAGLSTRFDWRLERNENEEYLARHSQKYPIRVLQPDSALSQHYAWELLSVAFFDGRNFLSQDDFFAGSESVQFTSETNQYVGRILSAYGFMIAPIR